MITCGCGDTTQFAKDAFKIAFPDEELPIVIEKNKENEVLLKFIIDLLDVIVANQGSNHQLSGEDKFAYYIQADRLMRCDEEDQWYNDMDIQIFDLIKGYYI